jgi:hypothetical protein
MLVSGVKGKSENVLESFSSANLRFCEREKILKHIKNIHALLRYFTLYGYRSVA